MEPRQRSAGRAEAQTRRPRYPGAVQAAGSDEERLFGAIARSGVRVLLIGRQAMIMLGVPAYAPGIEIAVPTLDDLIRTKRWALRQKDVIDIQLLEALRRTTIEDR
jgi:hypothetical protein